MNPGVCSGYVPTSINLLKSAACWGPQVIPASWLRLFNAREVNQLLSGGAEGGLDAGDMAAHARYSGGYTADSPTVRAFWKARQPWIAA